MTLKEWTALGYDEGTWHHRQLLFETVKKHMPFKTLLDVGCAHGPDLAILNAELPDVACSGFDITEGDIEDGKVRVPNSKLWVADIREELPKIPSKSYDVVLTNGVMMYMDSKCLRDVVRIARKSVILSERDPGEEGDRQIYKYLTEDMGLSVAVTKITREVRDSWKENGYIYEISPLPE